MYKQLVSRAKDYHAKYMKRTGEKYHYWEIGGEQSIGVGPCRDSKPTKIKIKAILNSKRKVFNAIEEVIQWRKFE